MNFLGRSDYDMQEQLSRWHSQGLWNRGFNLDDAFSKSLSIVSECDQEIPQSQTAHNPLAPRWTVFTQRGCCTVSHFSYALVTFSGPTIFDENAGIKHSPWWITYRHFISLMKSKKISKSLMRIILQCQRQLWQNARSTWTSLFSICVLR